ncbi:uncharacterized protein LOC135835870 isoform X2 [Planococcus citri]
MTEGNKERPKTLSLQSVVDTTPTSTFRRYSRDGRVREAVSIEEVESGSRASDADKNYDMDLRRDSSIRENEGAKCASYEKGEGDRDVVDVSESVKNIEISSNQSDVFVSDLKLRFENDNCGCERTSLRVRYKKNGGGASHSAPTTPSSFQKCIASENDARKHRSSLTVDRSVASPSSEIKRPFTSVNLTLRPPCSERQPAPINILTKGSNLTYSACSYNSKQGYQNQLQISISEEGNTTLSASRTKAPSPKAIPTIEPQVECDTEVDDTCSSIVPGFIQPLSSTTEIRLQEQIKRKNILKRELDRDKLKLHRMRQDIETLEIDLQNRRKVPVVSKEILALRAEVRTLQMACAQINDQIDMAEQPCNMYLPAAVDNGNWTCLMCTFKNHPMLPKCEQCDMAKAEFSLLPNIIRPHTASPQLPAIHPRV